MSFANLILLHFSATPSPNDAGKEKSATKAKGVRFGPPNSASSGTKTPSPLKGAFSRFKNSLLSSGKKNSGGKEDTALDFATFGMNSLVDSSPENSPVNMAVTVQDESAGTPLASPTRTPPRTLFGRIRSSIFRRTPGTPIVPQETSLDAATPFVDFRHLAPSPPSTPGSAEENKQPNESHEEEDDAGRAASEADAEEVEIAQNEPVVLVADEADQGLDEIADDLFDASDDGGDGEDEAQNEPAVLVADEAGQEFEEIVDDLSETSDDGGGGGGEGEAQNEPAVLVADEADDQGFGEIEDALSDASDDGGGGGGEGELENTSKHFPFYFIWCV